MNTSNPRGVKTIELTDAEARLLIEERYGMEFGVEVVRDLPNGKLLSFVQRPDSYDETLVTYELSFYASDKRNWFWSSWGDEVERARLQHDEEDE